MKHHHYIKIVISPLIFFIKKVVKAYTEEDEEEAAKYLYEYHELIASAIQTFCHVPGTDELIQAIRARKSLEELKELDIVQHCFEFTKEKSFDLNEYKVVKK